MGRLVAAFRGTGFSSPWAWEWRLTASNHDWSHVARETIASEHVVQVYEADADLLSALSTYAAQVLRAGDGLLLLVTPDHADAVVESLAVRGLDPAALERSRRLTIVRLEEVLPDFLQGRALLTGPFYYFLRAWIDGVSREVGVGRIHVFDETGDVLRRRQNVEAAIDVERTWSRVRATHRFTLYCAYREPGPLETLLGGPLKPLLDHHSCALEFVAAPESSTSERVVLRRIPAAAESAPTPAVVASTGARSPILR